MEVKWILVCSGARPRGNQLDLVGAGMDCAWAAALPVTINEVLVARIEFELEEAGSEPVAVALKVDGPTGSTVSDERLALVLERAEAFREGWKPVGHLPFPLTFPAEAEGEYTITLSVAASEASVPMSVYIGEQP
jgi:hypothetical protein